MQLYINNKQVPFQLEQESDARAVLQSIIDWAADEGSTVGHISVNNHDYADSGDERLAAIPVDQITAMHVEVLPPEDYAARIIAEVETYASRARDVLRGDGLTAAECEDLVGGISWMKNALTSAGTYLNLKLETAVLLNSVKETEISIYSLREALHNGSDHSAAARKAAAQLESLAQAMDDLFARAFLEQVKRTIPAMTPARAASRACDDARSVIRLIGPRLTRAAEEIQSGRDASGMALVRDVADGLAVVLSLLDAVRQKTTISDARLAEVIEQLRTQLSEIENCFTRNDFVYLSDILEYELTQRLTELEECVQSVAERIPEQP